MQSGLEEGSGVLRRWLPSMVYSCCSALETGNQESLGLLQQKKMTQKGKNMGV